MNDLKLDDKQLMLLGFVIFKHGQQKRKYTNKPYHTHLTSVANIVSKFESGCIEIALCHDLFEDTDCTFKTLFKFMISIGYEVDFSYNMCKRVEELTDFYTKENFPEYTRDKRKEMECKRLSTIDYISQTVKYADLIDNVSSIVEHDKEFAKIYLREKKNILSLMNNGNKNLCKICLQVLNENLKKLSIEL